ncbi:MAG TPA: bacteriohemerythrin [Accumulibacter sp.]|nr:bacteriohemerythrin [Accumulibacter sp.]HMW18875.1 bacteriohemerythrin [Accumulibacter sp.]HMX23930.1 bacteriohemerythrin [Accumulibacter sp.]HMY07519.1 bacteriohemerythrin [Accumulibacter sp.]HNC18906.1 bacteriohemerythrin [Accumulibacter sp.]
MEAFSWNECYVTGLTAIDEQHRHLVGILNGFGELLMQTHEPTSDELETISQQLTHYAQYHFQEEEKLMVEHQLDHQMITAHVADHQRFIQQVLRLPKGLLASPVEEARRLLNFLCDWLTYHILGSDQIMARAIAAQKSGTLDAKADPARVTKPYDPAVQMLLKALDSLFKQMSERNMMLNELNQTLDARVEERTRELLEANQRLAMIAMTDSLTGLPNRRQAMNTFRLAWKEALTQNKPLSCMMIDADGFKIINDTYGHNAGDTVLRQLAHRLTSAVRTDDHLFRLGGDEFMLLCNNTPLTGALVLAEKILVKVRNLHVKANGGIWHGSVSIGVAVASQSTHKLEELLKLADESVYLAKRQGRNCVATVCSQP